ncbi:ATP-dependent (S)-NAD(P)H-hydrate dehydratase-like [Drosophila tropicalis]|uniref:ATP-dependent (S)-NAD(P)H-hydrate dehydratase-like n=1 Tax=Drosophila tropicalis TaxID=46794 RepID=UPI0035ABCC11
MYLLREVTKKNHSEALEIILRIRKTKTIIMSKIVEIPVLMPNMLELFRTLVPKLTKEKYKGQYGRIGVVGGSAEYTGAPYFAAIASMKVGADLAHVFCQSNAATVIKCYSPDIIVHAVLDKENAVDIIKPWIERLHVVIIGPGLGRDRNILRNTAAIMKFCLDAEKPLVIDADGLFILNDEIDIVCGQRNVVLTPNAVEFRRLFGEDDLISQVKINRLGDGVVILKKGAIDKIYIPHTNDVYTLPEGGSGRRCGGQGDLLSGSLATFLCWFLQANEKNSAFLAACASSYFIKKLNYVTFQRMGRSLMASDMIAEMPSVFKNEFENKKEDVSGN